jgi:glucuronosyltransferase
MFRFSLCVVFLCFCENVFSANILFLNPMASPSHHLWNKKLIKGLADKGHNITMVSVDNDTNPPPNVHYIFLEKSYEVLYGGQDDFLLQVSEFGPLDSVLMAFDWFTKSCEGSMKSEGLDKIINYPDSFKFDLIIQDFSSGPCLLPLLHKFNYPPLVSVSAFGNPPYSNQLTGGQKFPAVAAHYTLNYPQVMNYHQRLFNSFLFAVESM